MSDFALIHIYQSVKKCQSLGVLLPSYGHALSWTTPKSLETPTII